MTMKRNQVRILQERTAELLAHQGIQLTPQERTTIEVADFGLGVVDPVWIIPASETSTLD